MPKYFIPLFLLATVATPGPDGDAVTTTAVKTACPASGRLDSFTPPVTAARPTFESVDLDCNVTALTSAATSISWSTSTWQKSRTSVWWWSPGTSAYIVSPACIGSDIATAAKSSDDPTVMAPRSAEICDGLVKSTFYGDGSEAPEA